MHRIAVFAVLAAVTVVARPSAMIPEQVKIDTGVVEGVTGTVHPSVRIYKGIPFAAPPVGENRWKAPQPAARWDGVFKANAFGPSCIANVPGAGRGGRGGGAPGRGGAPGAAPGAAPGGAQGRGGAPGAAPGAAPQAAAAPPAPPRQPPAS